MADGVSACEYHSGGAGCVLGEAEAGELPAGGGGEEVAIGGADVSGGRDAGASAEDDLGGHELAVVFAEGAGEGFVAGVAGVAGWRSTPIRRRRSAGGRGAGAAGVGWRLVDSRRLPLLTG